MADERLSRMTVRPIVITGEPVLHQRALPVESFDGELRVLVDDMFETMDAAHGVGLAAPQIGVGLRIFTWQMDNADGAPARGVIVNPFVSSSKPPQEDPDPHDEVEGCLSVPGESFPLKRGDRASVTGLRPRRQRDLLRGHRLVRALHAARVRPPQRFPVHRPARRQVGQEGQEGHQAQRMGRLRGTPGCRAWTPTRSGTTPRTSTTSRARSPAMTLTPSPLVIAVVGPTATGKSELALDLAEAVGGEVVNADASQLYRGMDIGTAKVPPDARRGIPHHQLDVLDVTEEASVAAYQQHARADLAAIVERGRHPIVVGGSGLYVRALLDRLEIPPTDPGVRARLEDEAARLGTPALYARLRGQDTVAAEAIEPNNTRRVVRALEVIELTGRRFSATMPTREYVRPTVAIGLEVPREVLDQRIAAPG